MYWTLKLQKSKQGNLRSYLFHKTIFESCYSCTEANTYNETANYNFKTQYYSCVNPLSANFAKWSNKLFECVWPFCGIGA